MIMIRLMRLKGFYHSATMPEPITKRIQTKEDWEPAHMRTASEESIPYDIYNDEIHGVVNEDGKTNEVKAA